MTWCRDYLRQFSDSSISARSIGSLRQTMLRQRWTTWRDWRARIIGTGMRAKLCRVSILTDGTLGLSVSVVQRVSLSSRRIEKRFRQRNRLRFWDDDHFMCSIMLLIWILFYVNNYPMITCFTWLWYTTFTFSLCYLIITTIFIHFFHGQKMIRHKGERGG